MSSKPFTRRDFLASSAAAAVAGAFGRPSIARAWQTQQPQQPAATPAPPPTPVFTPIRGNVGYFTMRGGTIGYLINPSGVVVVDSQYPAEAKVCVDGLNERSKNLPVALLINTHHHHDHSDGNVSFRGMAKKVVSHAKAAELMKAPPGDRPPADQLYPDTTFDKNWSETVGNEKISAAFRGPAHTSGDVPVTFERANVVHMGDLAFNQRHPVVDRAAGASIKNWAKVLGDVAKSHARDTTYIFGHANTGLPQIGDEAALLRFRDYLEALLAFVQGQLKAGKTKDEVLAMRDPLKGFETFGRFGNAGPREALTVAVEESTAGA